YGMMTDQLRSALKSLESRESQVIAMRFGLDDGKPRTLNEIGTMFGLSRERIRQIEREAMAKLRHPSRSQQLRDYA
ncbi:MAG: polymerase primary sigma factor, partial [Frankiaceae bacterium]|nr:polymerase primary sigma factor [Frankiaceae bacterium]